MCCIRVMRHLWRSEDNSSFRHVGHQAREQVVRLGQALPTELSHWEYHCSSFCRDTHDERVNTNLPGMVAHAFNTSPSEVEVCGFL